MLLLKRQTTNLLLRLGGVSRLVRAGTKAARRTLLTQPSILLQGASLASPVLRRVAAIVLVVGIALLIVACVVGLIVARG